MTHHVSSALGIFLYAMKNTLPSHWLSSQRDGLLPKASIRPFALWLTVWLALAGPLASEGTARVHVVKGTSASDIEKAIETAEPGDTVHLAPGIYRGKVTVRKSGLPERPVIIEGGSGEGKAVVDGGAAPGGDKNDSAFVLDGVSWVTIQNLEIRNSWTDVIVLNGSSYISIVGCDIMDTGRTVVAAHGPESHHILVERCTWTQNRSVYESWSWEELHHLGLKHYNGGLYGGTNAAGGVVIRANDVGYVFNGLRWFFDAATAEQRRWQANVEIYDNHFHHVRDNSIEPEAYMWNLHAYHNRLDSCPKGAVSIDGILGGESFFYGNTGVFRRDGATEDTAWTLWKFNNYQNKPKLEQPLHLYHNSFSYAIAFSLGDRNGLKANDHVIHLNNAYQHGEKDRGFGLDQWPGKDCRFDYDISSLPFHPDVARFGFEKHGISGTSPGFLAPAEGDFRLRENAAAKDAGTVIDGFTLWFVGKAPDMGAFEGEQRVYGKPFEYVPPPGGESYKERPRVVRIFARGNRLLLFFSCALNKAIASDDAVRLSLAGRNLPVRNARVATGKWPQVWVVDLQAPLPAGASLEVEFGSRPLGANGEPATGWAADYRVVHVPDSATLVGEFGRLMNEAPLSK